VAKYNGIHGSTAGEIVESIRELVISQEMLPGQKLPTVRLLAENLGVNRNTVNLAYQRLVSMGMAITNGRLGTVISTAITQGEQEGYSDAEVRVNLASGNPDPAFLPDPVRLMASFRYEPVLYGHSTLDPTLRSWAENSFSNIGKSEFRIVACNGAVDAIERLTAAHLVRGDRIAVEDPGYLGSVNALRLAGLVPVGVEVDDAGMLPAALRLALQKGVKAVLITPRAQNPTGAALTKARADELKAILREFPDILVIVDDHFSLLSGCNYYNVIPAGNKRWAVIRSLSKPLGPDLRFALTASDDYTYELLSARLAPGTSWVSHLIQRVVAECVNSTEVQESVAEAGSTYKIRRDALCSALRKVGLVPSGARDGFNVWIPFAADMDAEDVALKLLQKGWLVRAGKDFELKQKTNAIRVTAARLTPEDAAHFSHDLAEIVNAPDQ